MKKLESTLPNMFIVLTVISLISAAALAFTFAQTKPILDEQARLRQIEAVAAVVPEFDNQPTEERIVAASFPEIEIYPAYAGGDLVGTAVRSFTTSGYGGTITIMVGFDPEGVITGARVLSHTETPGLGARITEPEFLNQFVGRDVSDDPLVVAKDGGEIDAITAATISTRAFLDAINRAWSAVMSAGQEGLADAAVSSQGGEG